MNHPEFLEFGMIHEELSYFYPSPATVCFCASASIIF